MSSTRSTKCMHTILQGEKLCFMNKILCLVREGAHFTLRERSTRPLKSDYLDGSDKSGQMTRDQFQVEAGNYQ